MIQFHDCLIGGLYRNVLTWKEVVILDAAVWPVVLLKQRDDLLRHTAKTVRWNGIAGELIPCLWVKNHALLQGKSLSSVVLNVYRGIALRRIATRRVAAVRLLAKDCAQQGVKITTQHRSGWYCGTTAAVQGKVVLHVTLKRAEKECLLLDNRPA